MAAVLFQVKLALEGVIDGFDDLAQRLEELRPGPFRLAFAGRPEQGEPFCGEGGLEVAAVVVLVADDDLARAAVRAGSAARDARQGLALIGLGPGQGEREGRP